MDLTLILSINFCPENVVCFLHLQVHFRLILIMEANTMNPDQTAPEADLDPYCLQYTGFHKRAEYNCREWRGKGQIFFILNTSPVK